MTTPTDFHEGEGAADTFMAAIKRIVSVPPAMAARIRAAARNADVSVRRGPGSGRAPSGPSTSGGARRSDPRPA